MTVSICMITYNHEKYLKQAIDGVLMQKTNFDFELVIANDNSPDNTKLIVEDYITSHPNGHKIKFLNNTVNMGMMPNFTNAISNCNGKYIALCEGDDYWTDENKLQKQFDFLEKNKKFSICFHKVNIDNQGTISEDTITKKVPAKTTIKKLAKGNYIHTCSVMYRNNLFDQFPDYFYKAPVGDYFLHLLNSRHGNIYCINEIMANYRVHDTSYWSSKKQEERSEIWINFLIGIMPNFDSKTQRYLQIQIDKTKGTYLKKNLFQKIKSYISNKN
jgi:glycosyltransferase involved in cell wall biosynthesis